MTELMTTGLDLHSDPSADPIMDIIAGGTRYKVSDFFSRFCPPPQKYLFSPVRFRDRTPIFSCVENLRRKMTDVVMFWIFITPRVAKTFLNFV